MSLSFADSLKKTQEQKAVAAAAPMSLRNENIATTNIEDDLVAIPSTTDETANMIAAYDGWMKPDNSLLYIYYNNEYHDDKLSTVNDNKQIMLSTEQINLTQEKNSQYIPFEINRYYDGFDLSKTDISIYWVNERDGGSVAIPVDVYYNSNKIRFAWLIDDNVTKYAGGIKFEIQASGVNSQGFPYLWKTKPNNGLNVLQALEFKTFIEPDEAWQEGFVQKLTEQADRAEKASSDASAALNAVQTATAEVKAIRDELLNGIDEEVASSITEALLDYATIEYVNQEIDKIDVTEQLPNYALKTEVETSVNNLNQTLSNNLATNYYTKTDADTKVAATLADYATKEELEEAIDGVDVTEQLKDYALIETVTALSDNLTENYYDKTATDAQIATSLENYATKEDVEGAISSADLDSYYKKTETYSQTEIDEKLANVSVDLTGYATETYVNNKVDPLSSSITTNTEGIAALSSTVTELQKDISGIDKAARLTYDATYNTEGDYSFILYEIENEGNSETEVKTEKAKFVIQGGGGGSTTSSVLKIEYVTKTPLVATIHDNISITYNFSGTDSSGDDVLEGTATWKVAGRTVATNVAVSGENTFDITEHINLGTQKVTLSITDEAGSLVTKSWTVQKIDVRLESTFNDKLTYPIGTISFDYTPYGAIEKDVHFVLDGKEIGVVNTTSSGIPMAYTLPEQKHGSHLLDVYITATINGNNIESNHIVKDIAWYDETSTVPVITTTYQKFTARQYDSTNIEYTVNDPTTETPTVKIAVDGVVVSTPTLESNTAIYQFKTDAVGEHIITITCGVTVKTLVATITKLDIKIEPVTAGLVFDFNPSGKSNNDTDRVWSDGDIAMSVSDNFDWVNGGYQIDKDGDQYFCIKAGTSANINYKLFADDAKKNGKEFKLVFKSTNVQSSDATFLSCIDNVTGTDHIGIQMNVHEACIYGQAGKLQLPYSEEDVIEFEFNISKNTEAVPMVMGYEDGVSTRPLVYDDSYNFTQATPKTISLGSDKCDLHIYRFKVYNTSLTDRGILNNFIADARNASEMIKRYDRNQIYDENQKLDPDVLAEKCPWIRVYKLSAPYFTNNKSDKVPNTTIQQIYKDGDIALDNWTCYNAMHSGQGTSSNNYGAAGRNLDFIMNKSGIDGVKPYFILGNGNRVEEITLTRTSVPVAYLNAKVNIASANNMTNAMLANRYNKFNPHNRPFVRGDGVDTSFIKDTMEFYNCVIFVQETNEDLSTHREFADTEWHFYAIGNIGDSKKTDKTRLTDMNDKYECCVEIMDVELPLSDFPADTMYNAMGYKIDEKTKEKIYTWAKNENLGILYEKIDGEYVLTSDTSVDLTKTYYVDILEHDDFSEDFTYGWRYIYEGDDKEENAEVFDYCKQKWIELYRFITTSTDEEFKARFGDYFVLDSALYNYLFTTRYCMVDNRAKNSFWHYSKTGEVDGDGNPIRKWDLSWGYDMDTALGLNNYGKQVYRYGLEDTDVDEKGEEIFRESDSTFFCRLRDLFSNELKAMYNTLESQNAWHAESFINQADAWQSEFPEELWRVDIERKYIRTYNSSFISGAGDAQFLVNMANGKMKYHRRQWERNQEKYMASKYQSSVASSDNAVLRCTVPTGDLVVQPNYKLKITPYAYMYLNVKYGTQNPIQVRATPNVEYEIPFEGSSADIIDIYSASFIKSLGDLSSCYAATVDTSRATKLTELIIGNDTVGYDNPSLTTLTLGANYLLEMLNVENVSGLTQSLNLTALNNLKELYAKGSNTSGVTFADGGRIEIAELPAINAMSMKNLIYLTTLDIVSLNKLTSLTVEHCNTIDLLNVLNSAKNLNRVRLIGVNWNIADTTLLERIYKMAGIDKNGYNIDKSILTGKVHVPVIRQQQLYDYKAMWPDLEITFDTMIEQFAVTFKNDDGTVLEVQYVDKGASAIDPVTRADNPIPVPKKASSVSTNYTYAGWDSSLDDIFSNRTITAIYTGSLRSYTIKYVSKGITLQESTGLYGDNVLYNGAIPTYTVEESGYKYYLFNRWDKSGFIDGNKTVNAIFDVFEYTDGYFNDKQLKNLTPIELYALTKIGIDTVSMDIQDGDDYSFKLGYDVNYDDIESETIISRKTTFDGTNHIDTGISLFDGTKDFVLAMDYEVSSNSPANGVLAQCFQSNGSNGFKLWYNSGVKFTWGTSTNTSITANSREMLVIRYKAGENNITIYNSNLNSTSMSTYTLTRTKSTVTDSTLVLGCMKADDGAYENFGQGDIHWCKVWYKDLGAKVCQDLANWIHEDITLEVCGFKRYYLSENSSQRCNFTLLATHLLDHYFAYNTSSTNAGGWASSHLNSFLNSRVYNAMPHQIRALLKRVVVSSTIGSGSSEISSSNCYITIPSILEVNSSYNREPYIYEAPSPISYMTSNNMRRRATLEGTYYNYWLRSPYVYNGNYYYNYVHCVRDTGYTDYYSPSNKYGIVIEISF